MLSWRNELVTPAEWDSRALDEVTAVPVLYMTKAALQSAFNSEGDLIAPLSIQGRCW